MGLQGPQETSSPFPGPRPEWPVQRLLRALHRGRLTPSRGSTGRRRVATPKAGGLPRPQQADLVTGRAAGSASHALWPLGRGGDARPSHTLGQPQSSRSSSAASQIPLAPQPDAAASQPDPGRHHRGAHHPVTRVPFSHHERRRPLPQAPR